MLNLKKILLPAGLILALTIVNPSNVTSEDRTGASGGEQESTSITIELPRQVPDSEERASKDTKRKSRNDHSLKSEEKNRIKNDDEQRKPIYIH
ncbi:MAG: hypothetical protein QM449_05180 [Synergistota bacterium]|nr:hypothetical protein [Synergistota bacterium]